MRVTRNEFGFTPPQMRVIVRSCMGLKDAAVAAELGLSIKTIEKHKNAAYKVARVGNLLDMTRWCIKRGVFSIKEWLAFEGSNYHSQHSGPTCKTLTKLRSALQCAIEP